MGRKNKPKAPPIPLVHIKIPIDQLKAEIEMQSTAKAPALEQLSSLSGISTIVCLGIGDPCISGSARVQTNFAIQLKRKFNSDQLIFYDPCLCGDCQSVLEELGFSVLREEQKVQFAPNTVFFMPHCPRFLYNNILADNWNPASLQNMLIIGNSFSDYEEKCRLFIQPIRSAVEDLFSAGCVSETKLSFGDKSDVFDSISLMTINKSKLPLPDDVFWSPRAYMQPKPS